MRFELNIMVKILSNPKQYDVGTPNDSSSIESKSRKNTVVNKVKHIVRVWSAKTINEKYMMFLTSDIADEYKQNNVEFPLRLLSYFYRDRCLSLLLL